MRVIDLVMQRAEIDPHAVALIDGEESMSFRQLVELVESVAATIETTVEAERLVELSGRPADQVVGLFAAMAARRPVIFGSVADRSETWVVDQRLDLPDQMTFVSRRAEHRWVGSLDGFAVVVPTSGTTGRPKLVVHDDESLAGSLILTASVEDELHVGRP